MGKKSIEDFEVEQIAHDIHKMIARRAKVGLIDQRNEYKDAFEELCGEIENYLAECKSVMENFKQEQLSINAIEAEGGYRAVLTLFNYMTNIKTSFSNDAGQ